MNLSRVNLATGLSTGAEFIRSGVNIGTGQGLVLMGVPLDNIQVFSTDGSVEDAAYLAELTQVIYGYSLDEQGKLPAREGALDLEWISFSQQGQAELNASGVGKIVDGMNAALRAGRFDVINTALETASLDQMSLEAIVAFMRVPYVARFKLSKWADFVARAKVELEHRGLDSARLTRGIT